MRNIFRFILFCRITHDPFCSIEIKITTLRQIRFHVCIKMRRYIIKNVSVKERYFPDNLIPVLRSKEKLNIFSIAHW